MANKKDNLEEDLETAFKDKSYSEVEILSKLDFKTNKKLRKSDEDEFLPTPTKEFPIEDQPRRKFNVDEAKEGKLISCKGAGSAIKGTKFKGVF